MSRQNNSSDLHRSIGQLLIIGFDGTEMSPGLAALLTRVQPAGVILFARNITGGEQTYKLLKDCQACVSTPLFTAVDMEGGRVDRFRNVLGRSPSAADVFATRRPQALPQARQSNRRVLPDTGIQHRLRAGRRPRFRSVKNSNEFPRRFRRSETGGPLRPRISQRIGALPTSLAQPSTFPDWAKPTSTLTMELPSINKSWKNLWAEDLYPYRTLRRELPMVLIGHANYPAITHDESPASLSKKWITDVLRKKIGYRGLVVSDDLEMGGVLKAAPIEQAAVEHIRAGGDLCLICHIEEYVTRSYEALIKEAEGNRKFAQRVEDSARRVLAFKKKSSALKRQPASAHSAKLEKLSRQI